MKLLTFNSDVTVSLGKKNVMVVELPDNLKDEDIVRLFRLHKSRQIISIGDPQVCMEDLGVKADRPGVAYSVQQDGTVDKVEEEEQGDLFEPEDGFEIEEDPDGDKEDDLDLPPEGEEEPDEPVETIEPKDEVEAWILNGNAFGDEEQNWEALLRRKKSGETWMAIANSIHTSSTKLSTAWNTYKKRVKDYLAGEEHGAA